MSSVNQECISENRTGNVRIGNIESLISYICIWKVVVESNGLRQIEGN